jgi:hypothetical protein
MKIGMSKSEARSRIEAGEYTWEDLRRLLEITHPILEGDTGKQASRVNKGMSLATAFNIHWRGLQGKTGSITTSGDQLGARNLIRDFGDTRMVPRAKPEAPKVHHEELMDIK